MKKHPAWYYDEFKQVGVDYADIEEIQAYDFRMQKLRDIEKEVGIIRDVLEIKDRDLVLEVGTGTGELALNLSQYCRKIIAVDVSEKMIEFARIKAEKQGKENIRFCHAGFLTYENHDESFDIIIAQLVLHHLPDFWKMVALRRIYKMLKDGGKFYLRDVVFPSHIEDYDRYFTGIITGLKKTAGEKIANETEIHIREEFSTLDWIMEGLLKKAGFRIEETKYFDGFIATYVCKK
jgi:putative AdoMet-dependent methyltransferase